MVQTSWGRWRAQKQTSGVLECSQLQRKTVLLSPSKLTWYKASAEKAGWQGETRSEKPWREATVGNNEAMSLFCLQVFSDFTLAYRINSQLFTGIHSGLPLHLASSSSTSLYMHTCSFRVYKLPVFFHMLFPFSVMLIPFSQIWTSYLRRLSQRNVP